MNKAKKSEKLSRRAKIWINNKNYITTFLNRINNTSLSWPVARLRKGTAQ